jgi:predicted MPP superfamily phosphohydrolase
MPDSTWLFHAIAAATAIGIPLYAWRVRGRTYATFSAVLLALSLPGAVLMEARLSQLAGPGGAWVSLAFTALMAATGAQLAFLVTARLRGPLYRWFVSVPGQAFLAAGFVSGVWLLAMLPIRIVFGALDWQGPLAAISWLDAAPLLLCTISVATSLRMVPEVVRLRLGHAGPSEIRRVPVERHRGRAPRPLDEDSLRIVQIADPHLGPWQSIRQLQRALESLLSKQPDLVLLTGDFLTMEGRGSPGALARALEPLRAYRGRCYAIFGNHDHEDPEEVRHALESNGIDLLMDEERLIETPIGPLQLVGADYRGREREEHIQEVLERFPRRPDHVRLLMLHDPLTFLHVPEDDVDLTLSGHTHGGQVGLVSMGLDWTVLSRSRWPDHGLFARGRSRLYVHRGTGFYGFPLRIGVPGEASVLEIVAS